MDVEQVYVGEDNTNILDYLSSVLEHVQLVDGKTNKDPVDIAIE
jgi:hypothetical protein